MLLFLVGMPGSGKSTLLRELTPLVDGNTIDLDNFVQEQCGMSISELFSVGQDFFRQRETEALHLLIQKLSSSNTIHVVATGGGTPCFNDNMALMKAAGKVAYLKVATEKLGERLRLDKTQRPLLLKTEEELSNYLCQLEGERKHFYEQADYIVDADELPLRTFAKLIQGFANLKS